MCLSYTNPLCLCWHVKVKCKRWQQLTSPENATSTRKREKCILHFKFNWQNDIRILHMARCCHTQSKQKWEKKIPPSTWHQTLCTTEKKITYGLRKKVKYENWLFFFKKKAEPEIDVAVLKKISLVVRPKCHARILYIQTSIGALHIQFKLNNRFACVYFHAKYDAIEMSITTNGNTQAQSQTVTMPNMLTTMLNLSSSRSSSSGNNINLA